MRSTSGGSRVAASTRTLRSVIQCDGVVTTLIADSGERRCPPQDGGVEIVDAISAVTPLLVCAEGPHCRFRVRHQPVHSWLRRQPADVREEDHRLPFLGGAHSRGHLGLVCLGPALGDPGHGHARPRGPRIHRHDITAEGGQRRQVMEPDARASLGGQYLWGVCSPAVWRQKGHVPMVFPQMGAQGLVKLRWYCPHRIEGVIEGPLVWVPRASVRHTLCRVLEICHGRRGYGHPRKRRQRRGDRHER